MARELGQLPAAAGGAGGLAAPLMMYQSGLTGYGSGRGGGDEKRQRKGGKPGARTGGGLRFVHSAGCGSMLLVAAAASGVADHGSWQPLTALAQCFSPPRLPCEVLPHTRGRAGSTGGGLPTHRGAMLTVRSHCTSVWWQQG